MMLFIPIFTSIICAGLTAAAVYYIVRTVKQQIKLHYSIQLVILKTRRLHFLIAAACFLAGAVLCLVYLISGGGNAVYEFCQTYYSMSGLAVTLTLSALLVALTALAGLNGVMFFGRCAVVDRGIQTTDRFIGWHKLYYYLVDEEKNNVLFSLSKKGPYTLLQTIGAYSFAAADAEKIKFILNKNKNKFLKHYDVR